MKTLLAIENVLVLERVDGSLQYTSCARIDGDGSGPSHGDPDYQPDTTYQPALDADVDRYIVVPPQIVRAVPGIVIGCRARVTNQISGASALAVVGDIGPHTKIGEMSIACARALGIPASPVDGGDERRIFLYELWPGIPAAVDGREYRLQPRTTG